MRALRIVHLFPDLLNLYGDGGNVRCLQKRCEWRKIPVQVEEVHYGESIDLREVDLVFFGGGPDREQRLATEQLLLMKEALSDYIEDEGVLLAICGGYQILGKEWVVGDEGIKGLSLLDITTKRPTEGKERLIGDIVISSDVCTRHIIGYENHAGRTLLGGSCKPFGRVVGSAGFGNNGEDRTEGIIYKHVVGSYLHGPLLAKNPEVSDLLLQWVFDRREKKGDEPFKLVALDDTIENEAADHMFNRLGVH